MNERAPILWSRNTAKRPSISLDRRLHRKVGYTKYIRMERVSKHNITPLPSSHTSETTPIYPCSSEQTYAA